VGLPIRELAGVLRSTGTPFRWASQRAAERATSGIRRWHAAAKCVAALLLLSAPPSSVLADNSKPLTAILIVARSELLDPNFADSIVLVMNNLGPAPVGVIVNRPTRIPVSQLFPELQRLAHLQDKVYFGGPVETTSVWFLFRAATPPEHAIRAFGSVYVSADRKLLLQLLGREKPMDGLRIFAGHAGWGPGQLEAEIDRGDWTSKRADSDAIFGGHSEHPWPAPAPSGPPVST
jgi:putative transcriptional regulator